MLQAHHGTTPSWLLATIKLSIIKTQSFVLFCFFTLFKTHIYFDLIRNQTVINRKCARSFLQYIQSIYSLSDISNLFNMALVHLNNLVSQFGVTNLSRMQFELFLIMW